MHTVRFGRLRQIVVQMLKFELMLKSRQPKQAQLTFEAPMLQSSLE